MLFANRISSSISCSIWRPDAAPPVPRGASSGVESLAAAIGEERDTIEEVYEPYLLQEGFISRTAKGRIATARAYNHFGRHKQGTLL